LCFEQGCSNCFTIFVVTPSHDRAPGIAFQLPPDRLLVRHQPLSSVGENQESSVAWNCPIVRPNRSITFIGVDCKHGLNKFEAQVIKIVTHYSSLGSSQRTIFENEERKNTKTIRKY